VSDRGRQHGSTFGVPHSHSHLPNLTHMPESVGHIDSCSSRRRLRPCLNQSGWSVQDLESSCVESGGECTEPTVRRRRCRCRGTAPTTQPLTRLDGGTCSGWSSNRPCLMGVTLRPGSRFSTRCCKYAGQTNSTSFRGSSHVGHHSPPVRPLSPLAHLPPPATFRHSGHIGLFNPTACCSSAPTARSLLTAHRINTPTPPTFCNL
jgi:hypothetical protein